MFWREKVHLKKQNLKEEASFKFKYEEELLKKFGIKSTDKLPTDSAQVKSVMQKIFKDSDDFNQRTIEFSFNQKATLYFFKGLTDENLIELSIVQPLTERSHVKSELVKLDDVITSKNYSEPENWAELIRGCLGGNVILHVSGLKPLEVMVSNPVKRSFSQPTTEPQIYGSKLGFIENSRSRLYRRIC
ncbi:hypothetical protein JCM9157_1398 [Halalkalibacter akibai JCM 9157]|uniref:Uncharacterized protein n=1 Tax=Halalkalibacter akibai (strain ATCC 43226 / DSM 21942 / CIP 109018 / JCM 9157 / 1139) TaxID=1236973 RepID=W4QQZ1_HALA3|nr:hypothetical protein JCM9157_1398 [Halalkalibacter akibai JCM 9157]